MPVIRCEKIWSRLPQARGNEGLRLENRAYEDEICTHYGGDGEEAIQKIKMSIRLARAKLWRFTGTIQLGIACRSSNFNKIWKVLYLLVVKSHSFLVTIVMHTLFLENSKRKLDP